MFTFFRRYQRVIYFIITGVIILSFSFFGTYSAFVSRKGEDPEVFRMYDGTSVTRSQCSDYEVFLSNDGQPAEGGHVNFLNDGVLVHDIIESGIGEMLVQRFSNELSPEWNLRLRREKSFDPYHHPQAPFVSALQVWSYFAPDVKKTLEEYQGVSGEDPVELYRKKAALFCAEKRFPSLYLRRVLMHQQSQFSWLEPDLSLEHRPLGIFGYQQLSDWFGSRFVERACAFIIEVAHHAKKAGWSVSTGEALASLHKNAVEASKRLSGEESAETLFQHSLRSLNMDKSRAAAVWADVLLFRRALLELSRDVIIQPGSLQKYFAREERFCNLECYQLQPPLRLTNSRDLWKFETYLQAVSQPKGLQLPQEFRSAENVMISCPELVEQRFIVSFSEAPVEQISKNIRLRDVWDWQDSHWDELTKSIDELRSAKATDRDHRLAALERLSPTARLQANAIAREHIIALHPEWVEESLRRSSPETISIGIRLKGGSLPFQGIADKQALLSELVKAPIDEPSLSLLRYTQDGQHFYRIRVIDRAKGPSVVSLPDALSDGTLDVLLDKTLEASYERMKVDRPRDWKRDDGSFKPFKEVKDQVAERHFAHLAKELDQLAATWKLKLPTFCQWDDAKTARVSVRFLPHLELMARRLSKEDSSSLISPALLPTDPKTSSLEERPLTDLWTLVCSPQKVVYRELGEKIAFSEAFSAQQGSWLTPRYSQALGPFVAKVTETGVGSSQEALRSSVYVLQEELGREAVLQRAKQLADEFYQVAAT